ncbi:unnamed protein product [Trichobilharzia szidati]|nr:unnamed protein product [Trichobilharzia szidati]
MEIDVKRPPVDRYNLAYIFLFLHGIGLLIPWNVFINAREYFVDYKLNTTTSFNADYRINLLSYFGFAAHFPNLCFAAWNTFYQSGSGNQNPRFRFLACMIVEIIVLALTIILALVDTSNIPGTFCFITIMSVVVINSCVGVHQTLTFGIAAGLPMKYSNAVIVGSNACGAIISIVNIITKSLAMSRERSQKSIVVAAVIFFLSAVLIILSCTVTFFWLQRLKFVRYYSRLGDRCSNHGQNESSGHSQSVIHNNTNYNNNSSMEKAAQGELLISTDLKENGNNNTITTNNNNSHGIMDHYSPQISKNDNDENDWDSPSTESRLVMSTTTTTSAPLASSINTSPADEKLSILKTNDINNKQKEQEDESMVMMTTSVKNYRYTQESSWYMFRNCFGICCFKPPGGKERCLDYWSKYTLTMRECWIHCINIWCVFFCSLSIFPAVQSRVRPVNPDYFISPVWFVDVTCFLFFNLFAMLGCVLCNWIQFPGPRFLWIPVWLRTLFFIPFYLSCNFAIEKPHLPVLITNDHVYVFGCIIFSFTNGYLASLGLMYAPRCCSPDRAPLAGMFGGFFLTLGVFSGVYASRGLNSLIY